jgi:hypothetical protein
MIVNGPRIAALCEVGGVSEHELARRLGATDASIVESMRKRVRRWKANEWTDAPDELVRVVADALGVEPAALAERIGYVRITEEGALCDFGGSIVFFHELARAELFSQGVSLLFREPVARLLACTLDELAHGLLDTPSVADARRLVTLDPDELRMVALLDLEMVMRGSPGLDLDALAVSIDEELCLAGVADRLFARLERVSGSASEGVAEATRVRTRRLLDLADRASDLAMAEVRVLRGKLDGNTAA